MTNNELDLVIDALHDISRNIGKYRKDYKLVKATNEFEHIHFKIDNRQQIGEWFTL
jgi:hypothetical protein